MNNQLSKSFITVLFIALNFLLSGCEDVPDGRDTFLHAHLEKASLVYNKNGLERLTSNMYSNYERTVLNGRVEDQCGSNVIMCDFSQWFYFNGRFDDVKEYRENITKTYNKLKANNIKSTNTKIKTLNTRNVLYGRRADRTDYMKRFDNYCLKDVNDDKLTLTLGTKSFNGGINNNRNIDKHCKKPYKTLKFYTNKHLQYAIRDLLFHQIRNDGVDLMYRLNMKTSKVNELAVLLSSDKEDIVIGAVSQSDPFENPVVILDLFSDTQYN